MLSREFVVALPALGVPPRLFRARRRNSVGDACLRFAAAFGNSLGAVCYGVRGIFKRIAHAFAADNLAANIAHVDNQAHEQHNTLVKKAIKQLKRNKHHDGEKQHYEKRSRIPGKYAESGEGEVDAEHRDKQRIEDVEELDNFVDEQVVEPEELGCRTIGVCLLADELSVKKRRNNNGGYKEEQRDDEKYSLRREKPRLVAPVAVIVSVVHAFTLSLFAAFVEQNHCSARRSAKKGVLKG